ncbi:MAG: peptide-methionine (S)-S-oxide reductase MsrA, partial [candidate division WOR-3 bacterium]
WGVEYYFEKKGGVISAVSGYMGGSLKDPSYQDVKTGKSGHYETVEVTYNPEKISYEELAKLFFEIHDPTQPDGQGPDIGEQYKSVLFYNDEAEKKIAEKLIAILKSKGYNIVTKILPVSNFYKAEDYHQDYYEKKGQQPVCHIYKKRF